MGSKLGCLIHHLAMSRRRFILALLNVISGCFYIAQRQPENGSVLCDVQVWLRQTSLTPHPFFGACELAVLCASLDKRTLVSEKRMLRSAGRREGGGQQY